MQSIRPLELLRDGLTFALVSSYRLRFAAVSYTHLTLPTIYSV